MESSSSPKDESHLTLFAASKDPTPRSVYWGANGSQLYKRDNTLKSISEEDNSATIASPKDNSSSLRKNVGSKR